MDTGLQAALTEAIVEALEKRRPNTASADWAHRRYSWEVVAGKYLDFFGEVVRSRKPITRQIWDSS